MFFTRANMLRLLPLLAFLLVLLALAGGLLSPRKPAGQDAPIVGHVIPNFSLPELQNPARLIVPKQWRGQAVVVNVFASWCAPCASEHALLLKLAGERGVPLHGIAWRDSPQKAAEYLTRLGNPYASVAVDAVGQITVPLGLSGVPETMLIDKQGFVRWKYAGPLDESIIETQLLPLLKEYADAP